MQIRKKEKQLSLFSNNMVWLSMWKIPRNLPKKKKKKPFYVTNKFNKILWYKIDTQELIIFLYIAMNLWTPKFKLQYHLQLLKNWTT